MGRQGVVLFPTLGQVAKFFGRITPLGAATLVAGFVPNV